MLSFITSIAGESEANWAAVVRTAIAKATVRHNVFFDIFTVSSSFHFLCSQLLFAFKGQIMHSAVFLQNKTDPYLLPVKTVGKTALQRSDINYIF